MCVAPDLLRKTLQNLFLLICGLGLIGCVEPDSSTTSSTPDTNPDSETENLGYPDPLLQQTLNLDPLWKEKVPPSPIRFREASESLGLQFEHQSGDSEEKHFATANGSGVAMIDYNLDGLIDLFYANTRNLPVSDPTDSMGSRLFKNQGDAGFVDVTEEAGLEFRGFNHTATVGDVDGNGYPDLFLTNYGPNRLYLNQGDGRFELAENPFDVSPPWSSGAAFLDFDFDGDLDLYVSCYGEWSVETNEECGENGIRYYCSPLRIKPSRDYLYQNDGSGHFVDVTEAAGVLRKDGRGMGVLAIDINDDQRVDLYVANDLSPNYLFLNLGDGTFEDISMLSGTSASENGTNQAGMGVDAGDLDGDGQPEILVTNFRQDYNTIYKNLGSKLFQDVTSATKTVKLCYPDVGWGCALRDFDLDGHLDLFVVNGHVDNNLVEVGLNIPKAEPTRIWRGTDGLKFLDVADAGPYFDEVHVCRGAAFGDLDNDGDIDVAVNRMDDSGAILINESEAGNWIGFDLRGDNPAQTAVGAKITVRSGDQLFTRTIKRGGSYHSSNDPREVVGLGELTEVETVEIVWPGGEILVLNDLAISKYHLIDQRSLSDQSGVADSAQEGGAE